MHTPARARRILKWTGFGLSLLILAVWVLSGWWTGIGMLGHQTAIGSDYRGVMVQSGSLVLLRESVPSPGFYQSHWQGVSLDWPLIRWGPPLLVDGYGIFAPFWLLLLLTAIPTAWLWHRDRRRIRPGCCLRCGYNLTGNTSGVCSECGLSVAIALETSGQ